MANYARAEDVLPKELYEQVKKHFTGILYIPQERTETQERTEMVIALAEKKMTSKEIAEIIGLSIRRVNQILAERRKKKSRRLEIIEVP